MPSSQMERRRRRGTLARRIRTIVTSSQEIKFITFGSNNFLVSGFPQQLKLTAIGQGVSNGERIGNRIRLKAIHMRFIATNTGLTTYETVRIQVYKDKENQVIIAAPQAAILDPPDTSRYTVKFDKLQLLAPQSAGGGGVPQHWSFHHSFPGAGTLVEYDGPTGLTDHTAGAWNLYAQSSSAVFTIGFVVSYSLYYTDA